MLASEILRLVFGFAAVLGMIGLCALAAKKAGLASMTGISGGKRRLAMREMLPIDARRRLAIVKCDDKEYLILLGPTGETLIDKELSGSAVAQETECAAPQSNPFSGIGEFAEKLRAIKQKAA
ncbi:flagellar biosynthetic protein FliO [Hyphococcus sp.]|uniref:flagellar biosynthetic protein FliO n=1 Tax=Hyphococcus sp. TaxID=2038636 RepID=UPI003CCC40DF